MAEHTLGLMLAMARSIPQANASTKGGKWEKKKFLGTELRGKTLGVMGLGSIGREVVKRARAFEMKIVATDPFVSSQSAADLGIALVSREELYAQSDYITMHVALTTETQGMLNDAAFAQMKKGVRIVNLRARRADGRRCAACWAIESGHVGGAALDVFQTEPPAAGEPLLALDNVLATPHIGGSTEEAQEIVWACASSSNWSATLQHGVALNAAVNVPAMTAEQYLAVGPYIDLAERLGNFAAYVATGHPSSVRLIYHGMLGEQNTALVRNAGLAGVLSRSMAHRANVVNAPQLALDRGLSFAEQHEPRAGAMDAIRVELVTDKGVTSAEGTLVMGQPRLMVVDGIRCEAPLSGHLIFSSNADVPGVVGHFGAVLGKHGINIAHFSLGRQDAPSSPGAPLEAIVITETDTAVPEPVLQQILENKNIHTARVVEFKP